ncbi:MAG: hypothetical protein FWG12_08020, partial [Holophagaceae bacterium]|nr:hypothetical protein [Holophagaceae bacterium]
ETGMAESRKRVQISGKNVEMARLTVEALKKGYTTENMDSYKPIKKLRLELQELQGQLPELTKAAETEAAKFAAFKNALVINALDNDITNNITTGKTISGSNDDLIKAQKKFIEGLREEIETAGLAKSALIEYNAAKHGLTRTNSGELADMLGLYEDSERQAFSLNKIKGMYEKADKDWAEIRKANDELDARGNELFDRIDASRDNQLKAIAAENSRKIDLAKNYLGYYGTPEYKHGVNLGQFGKDWADAQEDIKKIVGEDGAAVIYKKALADINSEHLKLRAEAGETWAIIGYTVQENCTAAGDAILRWMNDLDGVGRSWRTLGDTVRSVISDMILQMQRAIFQKQVMDSVMGWISGLSWASPTQAANNAAQHSGAFSDLNFGGGFASGGSVLAGTRYLVGERGPEIFEAPTTGRIIPNSQIAANSGNGDVNNVSITINVHEGGNSDTRVQGGGVDFAAAMGKEVENTVYRVMQRESRQGGMLNPVFAR